MDRGDPCPREVEMDGGQWVLRFGVVILLAAIGLFDIAESVFDWIRKRVK